MEQFERVIGKYGTFPDQIIGLGAAPITDNQRKINKMMGISEESFQKHALKKKAQENAQANIDPNQHKINELMGISAETFQKHALKKKAQENAQASIGPSQQKINELMGISAETFLKHNR